MGGSPSGGARPSMRGDMTFDFPAKAITEICTVSSALGSLRKEATIRDIPSSSWVNCVPIIDSDTSNTKNIGNLLMLFIPLC